MKRDFSKLSLAALAHPLQSKKVILLLSLILITGSALRIYELGTESLWLDEVISVNFSKGSLTSIIAESGPARNNPPLYWLLLHYWMGWFGSSEVAVRSLSAIFGIGSILVIYLVGRELFGQKIGLIASFLATISQFHIFYSQEARNYALLLFLSLLSYLFFIKILKRDRKSYYLGYFLANLLLGYTHVYGLFIISSQIFYFLLFWNKYHLQRWKLTTVFIAIIASLSPLLVLIGPKAMQLAEGGFWIAEPTPRSLFDTFAKYVGGGWGKYILYLIFFPLALLGLFSIKTEQGRLIFKKPFRLKGMGWKISFESVDALLLLLIWLSFSVVIPFIASYITTPFYLIRYTIGVSPAFYLLVAKGAGTIQMKRLLYPLLIAIVIFSSFGLHDYYVRDIKEQWREVANLVESNSREGDAIVFFVSYGKAPFDHYYQGELPKFKISKEADNQEVATFINDSISGQDRLWFILGHPDQKASIESYVEKHGGASVLLEQKFVQVRVVLIDLPPTNPQVNQK